MDRITKFNRPALILDAEYSAPDTSETQNQQNGQKPPPIDPFAGFAGFAERGSFPTDAFPDWLGRYVRAVAEARLVPESMAGAAVLGIASAACGAGLRVANHLGELPANLFIVGCAETGTGKDLTLNTVAEPLREIEREQEAAFFDWLVPTLTARRDRIASRLRTTKGADAPSESEAAELHIELAHIERRLRVRPQIVVNDCTAQALAEVMSGQPGEAIASVTSEGRGPLAIIMGKFGCGKGASDEDFFAGAYSGTPRTVNRRGRGPTSEVFRLNRPCLTILWLLQPDAYRAALAEPGMIESGFLCRPLAFDTFAEPPIYGDETSTIPPNLDHAWRSQIRQLAETFRASGAEPQTVRLSPEAARILRDFSNHASRARSSRGPLRDVAGIAARWGENAYRVGLVLHAIEHGKRAGDIEIHQTTAQAAVDLVRWFAAETLALLGESRSAKRAERERRLLDILQRTGGEETLRTLRDNHGFAEPEIAEIAERSHRIEILEIRPETGRPSRVARLTQSAKPKP